MNTKQEIIGIAELLSGVEEITVDSHLVDDIGFDSLDKVEFIMDIEKHFEMVLDESACEDCKTIGDFVALVERKKS